MPLCDAESLLGKKRYETLRELYQVKARLGQLGSLEDQARRLFARWDNQVIKHMHKGKLKIVYVGTDQGQDFGGIIQGLRKFGEVVSFTHKDGSYGQLAVRPGVTSHAQAQWKALDGDYRK